MNILLVKIYYHLIITRFTYSPLGNAFKKQIETIEDQGKKQVDALENLELKEETNLLRINLIISKELQLYLMILLTKEKN